MIAGEFRLLMINPATGNIAKPQVMAFNLSDHSQSLLRDAAELEAI